MKINCRWEMKVVAVRQRTAVAGTSATEKQAIAVARPRMTSTALMLDPPPELGLGRATKLTDAPSVCLAFTLTTGTFEACFFAGFRWTVCRAGFAFLVCACADPVRLVGVG
jgi:hypothetical protein